MAAADYGQGEKTLSRAAGLVADVKAEFDGISKQLMTNVETLRSQWGGQGSTAFQTLAMAWNEKQQKIVSALNEFEQNLITTEKDNVSTDDAQQSWTVEDPDAFIEKIRLALYASKIVAYSQGFDEIRAGAAEYDWNIDLGAVSKIWRGGCIIRAQFLNRIADAYAATPDLTVLLTAPYFVEALGRGQDAWRRIVQTAAGAGIPAPAFSSSLAYYDGLLAERLPAALIQGQRDFFGAHTYKRIDKDGTFHTLWSGDRTEIEAEDTH